MKHLRFAALTLTLLLAACGGTGTTPTPPTTPVTPPTTPVTPPVTPVEPITPPADGAPVINSFTASPTAIDSGGTTTLSWSVTNSEIIRITPDPGQGDLSSATSATVSPTTTTTYNMEAVSLNGRTDTASVTVTVGGGTEQPPTNEVPYYGRWFVTFVDNSGVTFSHLLNITELPPAGSTLEEGGFGLQAFCFEGEEICADTDNGTSADGFGFIGNLPLEDGTKPLTLAVFSQIRPTDEAELKIVTFGSLEDTEVSTGNRLLTGPAVWLGTGDFRSEGTVRALLIGEPYQLDPTSTIASIASQEQEAARISAR